MLLSKVCTVSTLNLPWVSISLKVAGECCPLYHVQTKVGGGFPKASHLTLPSSPMVAYEISLVIIVAGTLRYNRKIQT